LENSENRNPDFGHLESHFFVITIKFGALFVFVIKAFSLHLPLKNVAFNFVLLIFTPTAIAAVAIAAVAIAAVAIAVFAFVAINIIVFPTARLSLQ
jgi:hypothetical protein